MTVRKRYEEPCSIFCVCLCESGTGKSQAYSLTIEEPCKKLPEPARSMILNEYTRKGLFDHLQAHQGRALIAHAEMTAFYESVLQKQRDCGGERQLLCRLYDGKAQWILTSASHSERSAGKESTSQIQTEKKEKREVLSENCVCIGGFTQPQPFLELYRPLATTQDGFVDRILIGLIRPHLLDEEEVEHWGEAMDKHPVQNFEG